MMKNKIIAAVLTFVLVIGSQIQSWAQCAMCRASVENNVSNGDTSIGAGLNNGILYLFVMPYLIAMVIGILWYRAAKKRKSKLAIR
ncbi:hypothetical protein SAMN04487988_11564 [Algoriphagus hitonicola]|uniref:Uncharacterized protein n=2 Tax=Algoriphagus hitonicola TaxID=435880 RepID=A0A1I2X2V0_9BACT|nr:hypothetical protein SAMN04487988_11564 [Algoriphagus hitonicola]